MLIGHAAVSFLGAVPQFTVPDLVQTAEYYRDTLGFQIAGYWDGERASLDAATSPVFAIVRRDEVQVFFTRADQTDVRTGRAEGAYDAYVRVRGIDVLADELRRRGADIVDGPEDRKVAFGFSRKIFRLKAEATALLLQHPAEAGRYDSTYVGAGFSRPRSPEPGARSPEPGARSPEPGARITRRDRTQLRVAPARHPP